MNHIGGQNHPFVLWGSCFLWIVSMFAITWALLIFFCMGDMVQMTGIDVVIALVLLSGIMMLPTNMHVLYTIGSGQRVSHKSKVLCCSLWMLIIWIIVICCIGVFVCIQRICLLDTRNYIFLNMQHYRNVPKSKRFMDNLQWSLKCCGAQSYKDWFRHDWYEKVRDLEWQPSKKNTRSTNNNVLSDSVPLSCCKSGTCVPNYLLELGTHSIHTRGCGEDMYRIYVISMSVHLTVFTLIIIVEIVILTCIMGNFGSGNVANRKKRNLDVRHLMAVNNKFVEANSSTSVHPDDSEDNDLRDYQSEVP